MSIESVMPSNHVILCRPLLLPPSIFPSIKVICNESVLHIRWPKYWSFCFSISPSNEYSGPISFRMDWLDLLAVQEESSPVPQFKSISSLVLSLLYGPTLISLHAYWKNHSFDNFDSVYLCWQITAEEDCSHEIKCTFNPLSRFVIAFFPRSKCLLISWLQSPSAVILKPKKIKSVTISIFPPICLA